jgi:hypothetical protein
MKYTKERVITDLDVGFENGIKYVIKSLGTHPVAYIGIEENHPLAGFDYEEIPIDVHGGFTFSRKGDGEYLPKGYWWYGWDYAHSGDFSGYYEADSYLAKNSKKYTIDDIKNDVWSATYFFEKLKKILEKKKT